MKQIFFICLVTFVSSVLGWAQSENLDSLNNLTSLPDSTGLSGPTGMNQTIALLDFKNTEVKDILRGLATRYNLNIFVDDDIRQRATVRLSQITVDEAVRFLVKENGLELVQEGSICKVLQPEIHIPEPEPEPLKILYEEGLLSVDFQGEEIEEAIRGIADVSGKNIILNRGVEGKISGYLKQVPLEEGLNNLMRSNGFRIYKQDGMYIIDRDYNAVTNDGKSKTGNFWVHVQDSLITLDVVDGDLNQVIRETARQLGVDVFSYGDLKGKIHAQCSSVTFDQVLNFLFKGTPYTFRRDGKIYFIGDKNISGISSTRLIRLKHIKAEGIIEILPPSITSKSTLKIIKEHNGLMIVGPQDVIRELDEFIGQIDYPIPQILIEAVVVDFTTSDIREFGLSAWMGAPGDSTVYTSNFFPGMNVTLTGKNINKGLEMFGPQLGLSKIGRLPDNFLLNLRAMESDGKANIRSQPQIATLNGHPASIKIGTTQYYKLISEQPIVGGNQAFNQVTQRFEKVTAEISLTITPWVSASGEITTEIKPEFSTPRGFDPEVPPTIDHRILDSTVRLRDGETIILGGLIQTDESENISKFPILGDIPVIGRFFQSRSKKKIKSKLMIYITPHLMYSSEDVLIPGVIQ